MAFAGVLRMTYVRGFFLFFVVTFACLAAGQNAPLVQPDDWDRETVCPGQFPSDLTQHSCAYNQRQRVEDWVTTSFTDQAILTSAGSALYGTLVHSPAEFPRTFLGFGERLRVSYVGGVGNSTMQFLIGTAFRLDQRHISCAEELNPQGCTGKNAFLHRSWHVVKDTVMVRHSKDTGDGARFPSPRILGAFAGAYAQSPWEPASENKPTAVLARAGTSMVTPFLGALLHEYPSISKALTKPLHLSRKLPPIIKPLQKEQTENGDGR
jgi:hypothetical protein